MKLKTLIISFCVGVLISLPTLADDFFMSDKPPAAGDLESCENDDCKAEAKWDASIEFGYVAVSGNTETDSLNGRFSLNYEVEKWRHGGYLATQSSSSDDRINNIQTDASKFTAQVKSDYKFDEKAYAFGLLDYDDTQDSGFEYQTSLALGGGYSFIKSDSQSLDAELGFGQRKSKEETTLITNTETISRIAAVYKWQISKTADFEQKLSSEIGDDNTVSKSETSLSAKIVENLALKVSYSARHQSDVPAGNENLETVTSFTVVYTF